MCPGCYKPNVKNNYCVQCRKKLFNGQKVSHILPFETPKDDNFRTYQEQTRKLSISGVQLKYSLRLENNELTLSDENGQYILKPIPPSVQIIKNVQAPENEHLTMQIAAQIFRIDTADNALIFFKDGIPAYITRRFDVKKEGDKYLQEDMAQLSGRSRQTLGENFKYEGTYEEIGKLIHRYVPAAKTAVENFFRIVVFNYLFSNGDAHLKNFSLIQTPIGDYTLSKAYDLMSTVIHTPNEGDTALSLYEGDTDNEFYSIHGCYGQVSFRELAARLGILPERTTRILTQLLSSKEKVVNMIRASFLTNETKEIYQNEYFKKLHTMGMTHALIAQALNSIDIPTDVNVRLSFSYPRGHVITGHFISRLDDNKYLFLDSHNHEQTIDGDLLINVERIQ